MSKLAPAILISLLVFPLVVGAWGEKGHLIVNRLAIEASSADLPPFMAQQKSQLIYNSYEPDRWRAETDSAMNTAQGPDHFFDSEMWGPISTIEPDRYAFMTKLGQRQVELVKIGYLPYAIVETYERLRNAFRRYRMAADPDERQFAATNALYYGGLLGHYVADSTMPMHLTIHYNGWADGRANPRQFTTDRGFHSRYENAYVNVAITDELVRPLVRKPRRLANVMNAVKDNLSQTFAQVEPMFAMEKTGEFDPDAPKPAGTAFIKGQIARASTFLGDLWLTAWVESAERPPQPQRR